MSEFLKISTKREDTFIAGNSMGGYGALKAALKRPDVFCDGAGLSSVSDIKNGMFDDILLSGFGDEVNIPDEDIGNFFCNFMIAVALPMIMYNAHKSIRSILCIYPIEYIYDECYNKFDILN